MRARVLVCDPIDETALRLLRNRCAIEKLSRDERLRESPRDLARYDALLVRSRTKVTRDVLGRMASLKVIGRAGVGVDNIDVEEATRRGVVVVTSPSGNTFSVVQHTVALMLAHFSNIAAASRYLKEGKWRKDLVGQELRGKVMGVVGLGRIGGEVARLCRNLGMEVIGHDPYATEERAKILGVVLVDFHDLLSRAHVVSVHVPLSGDTVGLIGREELALMRPDAFLINTARGGIVDEEALLEVLRAGAIGGAGIDVFSVEPPPQDNALLWEIIRHDRVIATPHLAASTREAQERVGEEVARGILAVLEGKIPPNCYNIPFIAGEDYDSVASFIDVAFLLGELVRRLRAGNPSRLVCDFRGPLALHDTGILKSAMLAGFLKGVLSHPVTIVNAFQIAESRGIRVREVRDSSGARSILTLSCGDEQETVSLSGTTDEEGIKIVAINNYPVTIRKPEHESYLLFLGHRDRPGMVGQVGTILGEANINIAFMDVGREAVRGDAVMVLMLDDAVSEDTLSRIRSIKEVRFVRCAKF